MNSVFVYCELEGTKVAEVSQELLTKGRKLANTLGVKLEAVAAGSGIAGKVESQILQKASLPIRVSLTRQSSSTSSSRRNHRFA